MRFRVRKQIKHNIYLFKVIKWGIKVVWNTMPCLFIINSIVTIICGIAFGMVPFVTQELYDSVTNIISNHGAIHQAYFKVLFLSLLLIIKEILNGINLFLDNLMNEKANCTMSQIIHKKMSLIDPIFFEDTHFFEDIEKATAGSKSIIYIVNMGIGFFTFNLPYFIVMWFYLKNLKPEFVLTILLIFLPVILTQFVRTGIIAKFEDESAPIRRETDYYIKTITEREYYKETRKLGAYSFFMERLLEGLGRLSKVEWKMNKRTNGLELLLSIASVMGYVGILYMLVASLLIFFYLHRLEQAQNEIERKSYEIELQRIYGETYQYLLEEVRKRQHAYKNHLATILGMHLTAQTLDELISMQRKYGDDLRTDCKFDSILTCCNNQVLAGFIYHRCIACENESVTVEYNIHIEQAECCFALHEIIEILGILIDNAFENVKMQNFLEQCIKIEFTEGVDKIIFSISNPAEYVSFAEIDRMFCAGYSSKGKNRGIGLARVLELVNKYEAEIKVYNTNPYDKSNWICFLIEIDK